MAGGPWEEFRGAAPVTAPPTAEVGPWTEYAAPVEPRNGLLERVTPMALGNAQAGAPGTTGTILPFSIGPDGKSHFDSNAGLLGMVKGAVTGLYDTAVLPGQVYRGEADLNDPAVQDRALAAGANLAGASPAARIGERAIAGEGKALSRGQVATPTMEELKARAGQQYDEVQNADVLYSTDAVRMVSDAIREGLEKQGFNSESAGKTFRTLDKLSNPPAEAVAVPLSGLETARRTFGKYAEDFNNGPEQAAATAAARNIGRFIQEPPPSGVVAGPAAEAGATLGEAAGNWGAFKRAENLDRRAVAAELRAASANAGQNVGNATRQRLVSMLTKEGEAAGYSQAELDAIEGIIRGGAVENNARSVSSWLGSGAPGQAGPGIALATAGWMATQSPYGAIAGLVPSLSSIGLRKVANALTQRRVGAVDDMIRQRSPLFRERQAAAPIVEPNPASQDAVVRALLAAQGIDVEDQPMQLTIGGR